MTTDKIYDPLPEGSQPKYKTAGYFRTGTLAPGRTDAAPAHADGTDWPAL